MKDWEDYRYALALSRYGSMVSAAASLGVTAATVSRHIERISDTSGVRIFELRGARWEVSAAGAPIIDAAERIEAEIAATQARTQAGADAVGNVVINTISFVNTYFLAPRVQDLSRRHPELLPVLDATDRTVSLAHGEADVGIRLLRPETGRLIRMPICMFPIALYAVPGADLSRWVGLPDWLDWLPEMEAARGVFGVPPAVRIDSYTGVAQAAVAMGLPGLVPTCIAGQFPELEICGDARVRIERQGWCVYHENNRGSAKVRAATDWVCDVLKKGQCACGDCQVDAADAA